MGCCYGCLVVFDIGQLSVYLSATPSDMRKGINGLSVAVQSVLEENPLSGHVFVFYNHARNKVKCLYYDRNGFALWYKVLERGRFSIPRATKSAPTVQLEIRELQWLLAGLDIDKLHPHRALKYEAIY